MRRSGLVFLFLSAAPLTSPAQQTWTESLLTDSWGIPADFPVAFPRSDFSRAWAHTRRGDYAPTLQLPGRFQILSLPSLNSGLRTHNTNLDPITRALKN